MPCWEVARSSKPPSCRVGPADFVLGFAGADLLTVVIMFMINASTALAAIMATAFALLVIVDSESRLRLDRVDDEEAWVWQVRDKAIEGVAHGIGRAWGKATRVFRRRGADDRKPNDLDGDRGVVHGERRPLLG